MSHVRSQLFEVLSGRVLSAHDDEKFRAHLRACAACREQYDHASNLLRLSRGNVQAAAPGELERMLVRATRLSRTVPGTVSFPWRFAFAGAAVAAALVLTVLAWPSSPAGRVLAATKGLRLNGVLVGQDTVVFAGAELTTEKEDAAVLLESAQGRRGLLLRPNTRLKVDSSDKVRLGAGRLRVQVKKGTAPFSVQAEGLQALQSAAGIFVVEQRATTTLVAVHQGTVMVSANGQQLELKDGQETELSEGALSPARPAGATALIEDRGDGTVWDAILRFLRQLIDVISSALAAD